MGSGPSAPSFAAGGTVSRTFKLSNASTTYTYTFDGNGNQTDDGKSYAYTFDAFNRLRNVNVRGGGRALVAEYAYNALNHQVTWHYDANASGTVDGSDATYSRCFDERWRVLATFRGTDTYPKERFVYHAAGNGGGRGRGVELY